MPAYERSTCYAPNDRSTFLSTLPATRSDRTAALAIVGISAILFALAVPFAGMPLRQVPAFVASYQSALAVSDIITAVLLLSQFAVLRSRALLLLSTGYLFTAARGGDPRPHLPRAVRTGRTVRCGLTDHGLALHDLARRFPAVRAGLWLAQGRQRRQQDCGRDGVPRSSLAVAGVFVAMVVFAWIVTAQHDLLPVLLKDGHYTPTMIGVVSFVWSLSFAALVTLWFRKPHTVIDVWLMVTMCAWLFDIALSAIVNVARFDLGFYAGRLYGLCAASFVLAVLLIENVGLQANTSACVGALQRAVALGAELLCQARAAVQRRRRVLQRRHHHEVARRHHHGLEQGRRTPVRLFRQPRRSAADRHHRAAGPQRRESAKSWPASATAKSIDQHETVRLHKDGRHDRRRR